MADSWDFFVSYTGVDKAWAEWIAWELEAEGHQVLVQEWDIVPGTSFVDLMIAACRVPSARSPCCRPLT